MAHAGEYIARRYPNRKIWHGMRDAAAVLRETVTVRVDGRELVSLDVTSR